MGSVRRRVSGILQNSVLENSNFPSRFLARKRLLAGLVVLPSPAFAQSCKDLRPDWDGLPVSALTEAILLFTTPLSLILLLASALVLRFRSNAGTVLLVIGWSVQVYLVTFVLPSDTARTEGCLGSPTLFIVLASAIAIGAVIYTGPATKPDNNRP